MPSITKNRIFVTLTVLMLALGMKWFYSTATVNDLRWILAPTAFFVELATGQSFTFESYAGYLSDDRSFLIAASCSGVNFLITAFLMLMIANIWKRKPLVSFAPLVPIALIAAYVTTIVANSVRIVTAIMLRRSDSEIIWLNPDQMHRFEGIFIYFGFLVLLFMVSERLTTERVDGFRPRPGPLKAALFPLVIYYATTLAIPIANGAFVSEEFLEHFIFVLLAPLLLVLPLALFGYMTRRTRVT